jgi:HlyD family secretion protein
MRHTPALLLLVFPLIAVGEDPKPATVSVSVVSPKKQTLAWSTEQPGTVSAFETTPVMAKLPGFVAKVHVDIGDLVVGPKDGKPGTLLAEVSIPELVAEGKKKAAEVKRAEADVELAKKGAEVATELVIVAEAGVTEAKAGLARVTAEVERWESELKRMEKLGGVIDVQSLDEARKQAKIAAAGKQEVDARVLSAAAAVRAAKARAKQAEADVRSAEARNEVAVAEQEKTKAMLAYTEIRAPFSGVVTARNVHTGHYLQHGGEKPEPLFVVAKVDTLRVAVDVPESVSAKAGVGAKATIKFPALGNREVTATVTRASGAFSPEARTLRVEIDLKNDVVDPKGEVREFKPGLYAAVKLSGAGGVGFTLPAAAVLFADETAYCYAVRDGKVEKLRVKTGKLSDGVVEVIGKRKAGTTGGEWVAFDGTEKVASGNLGALADGQAVTVK